MPERARTDSSDRFFRVNSSQRLTQARLDRSPQCDRRKLGAAVRRVVERVLTACIGSGYRPAAFVEKGGAGRRAADVESKDQHFTSAAPARPGAVSTGPSAPRSREESPG